MIMKLRWENSENSRYYEQHLVYKDLLGDVVVVNAHGGIGQATGAVRTYAMKNEILALSFMEREIKRRSQRGYILTEIKF